MAPRSPTTIDLTGPFFTKDVAKTLRQNADAMFAAVAAEGESDVKAQSVGFRHETGAFREGVRGRSARLDGAPFRSPGAVVSQTHVYRWARGGVRQYRGGKVEASRHMFRRTAGRLRRAKKLNVAELLRGLQ